MAYGDSPYVVEESEDAYENLNFAREALNRVYRPTGKLHSPGQTCKHIKEANPDYKSGEYYVDPNGESANDAILVYCKFDTEETCVMPSRATYNGQRWTKNTRPGQYFMEELVNGKEFTYNTDSQQLKFLQLLSDSARQSITYNCLNSSPFGARLTGASGDDLDSAMGRHKRSTYIDLIDHCVKDNQWHEAVFNIRTQKTETLPIVDMLLFDVGQENQQFGFEVGMVCFS